MDTGTHRRWHGPSGLFAREMEGCGHRRTVHRVLTSVKPTWMKPGMAKYGVGKRGASDRVAQRRDKWALLRPFLGEGQVSE